MTAFADIPEAPVETVDAAVRDLILQHCRQSREARVARLRGIGLGMDRQAA